MNEKQLLEYYKETIENNSELNESIMIDCDFEFDDDINIEEDILICGEKSNYEIFPFGKAGDGSIYGLLNGGSVAYISTDGGCGIVAQNIKEFFNIILTCKNITDYFRKGVFDNIDSFTEKFNMVNGEAENFDIIETFVKSQNLETNVEKIYEMFLRGIIATPSLILQANPEEYDPWDDVFGTNQEYIEELRNKAK